MVEESEVPRRGEGTEDKPENSGAEAEQARLKRTEELERELEKREAAVAARVELKTITKERMDKIESILRSFMTVYPEFKTVITPESILNMYGGSILDQLKGCNYCDTCNTCQSCVYCQGCYSCQKCQNCNSCQKDCQSCQSQNIVGNYNPDIYIRDYLGQIIERLSIYY